MNRYVLVLILSKIIYSNQICVELKTEEDCIRSPIVGCMWIESICTNFKLSEKLDNTVFTQYRSTITDSTEIQNTSQQLDTEIVVQSQPQTWNQQVLAKVADTSNYKYNPFKLRGIPQKCTFNDFLSI